MDWGHKKSRVEGSDIRDDKTLGPGRPRHSPQPSTREDLVGGASVGESPVTTSARMPKYKRRGMTLGGVRDERCRGRGGRNKKRYRE